MLLAQGYYTAGVLIAAHQCEQSVLLALGQHLAGVLSGLLSAIFEQVMFLAPGDW